MGNHDIQNMITFFSPRYLHILWWEDDIPTIFPWIFPWIFPLSRCGALGGLLRPGRVALAARGHSRPGSLKGLPGLGNPNVLWENAGRNGGKNAEKVWDINS